MYFAPESLLNRVSFHYKGFGKSNSGETELKYSTLYKPKSLPLLEDSAAKKPVEYVQYKLLKWKKSSDL